MQKKVKAKDRIVGSFSVRLQDYRDKRVGLMDAIVTDRNLRGKGIGTSLFDECIKRFQERNCEVILATADRYNSPSYNSSHLEL